MNLVELSEQNVEKFGEITHFIYQEKEYTNLRMQHEANKVAHGLKNIGVKPGDKVLVMLMNSPDVLISYQGILRARAIIIPIIFLLGPKEVAHIMKNSEAVAIITTRAFIDTINLSRQGVETLKHVIIVEEETLPDTITLSKLTKDCPKERPPLTISDDDLAVILYTSGTTGIPKGVMLTHKNLYCNAVSTYNLKPDRDVSDIGLFILPLSHSFGLTVMNVGFMLPNLNILMPWFDLKEACRLIEKYKVTGFAGVPAIYSIFLNNPDVTDKYDLSSLKECASGSAPLPIEVIKEFEEKFDCIILEGYGLSEAAPVVTAHYPDRPRKPGSIGQPIPGVKIKIVNEKQEEVTAGDVGELIVSGENVSPGYYMLPEKTSECFIEGWLYTGDLAKVDADGYVYIVDRKKDLIIRGGFNIVPRDIEEILYKHPSIIDAAVIGVPDKIFGEEIKAFTVVKPGDKMTGDDVIQHCKDYLADYKCPKSVQFLDALPRNAVGKILRKDLRKLIEAG